MTNIVDDDFDWHLEGLDLATNILSRAINHRSLGHAYLFHGPKSVGKYSLAKRFAQILVTQDLYDGVINLDSPEAMAIERGEFPDVEIISIGGICDDSKDDGVRSTRIRICQIRRLQRLAVIAPFQAARRIFIIDTVDDLQIEASHALLKLLEEPPPNVLLLLLVQDIDAILPTIKSRCQILPINPMPKSKLIEILERRFEADKINAAQVATFSRGCFGRAMDMLNDPSIMMLQESVRSDIEGLLDAGINQRMDYAQSLAGNWRQERESVLATIRIWLEWWSDQLYFFSRPENDESSVDFKVEDILTALQVIDQTYEHLMLNVNPQLAIEVMMLEMPSVSFTNKGNVHG